MAMEKLRGAVGPDLFEDSRYNNLDWVRLCAAVMVIYGHSYAISPSNGHVDIVTTITNGLAPSGSVAVAIFFFLSGILVARSAVQSSTARSFLLKRVARIWPALTVCVILSAFVFAPIFGGGQIDLGQSVSYVVRNVGNIYNQHFVDGVYESHPDRSLNGSLWSLTLEARLYLVFLLLMLMGVHRMRPLLDLVLIGLVVHLAVDPGSVPLLGSSVALYGSAAFPLYSAIFLVGALFFLNGGGRLNFLPAAIIFAVAYTFVSSGTVKSGFFWAFVLFLSLAVARSPLLLRLKLPGDYSYGVYLYGWPSQQIVYAIFPGVYPEVNFIFSAVLALALAVVSWHLLEKRVLHRVRFGAQQPSEVAPAELKPLLLVGGSVILAVAAFSWSINDFRINQRLSEVALHGAQNVVVENWGPQRTFAGEGFNIQANGESSIWFDAARLKSDRNYEVWFGEALLSDVSIAAGKVGSAIVPKEFFVKAGLVPIYLTDALAGEKYFVGNFEVISKEWEAS